MSGLFTNGLGGQSLNPLWRLIKWYIRNSNVLKDAAATAIYGSRF
jgi:hypothetical protein